MKKINFSKVDESLYYEQLKNGLKVFIYKKPFFQKKYAFFQTNYGAINNDFVPIGETKIKSFPRGIAHFLEHKLFESNDKETTFDKFENNGASLNASTYYNCTEYHFSSVENFDENLLNLINFVQDPVFTDENVEKEKGIIGQEIDMLRDDADRYIYEKLFENTLKENNYRYSIGGDKKTIEKITKEDLYECYNTFYNPSNMFLLIAGNVDEKQIINLIKKNQQQKNIIKAKKIVSKKVIEPEEVYKDYEVIRQNVATDKIGYSYKIKLHKEGKKQTLITRKYISFFVKELFGVTSDFTTSLLNKNIVKSYFYYDLEFIDDMVLIIFTADVLKETELDEALTNKLKSFNLDKYTFELFRKGCVANYVKAFESVSSITSMIRSMLTNYEKIFENLYEIYSELNYEDYLKTVKLLQFEKFSKLIMKPLLEDKNA
ncbi:MAG: pitrilysin family protein [Bacilli bacterium]